MGSEVSPSSNNPRALLPQFLIMKKTLLLMIAASVCVATEVACMSREAKAPAEQADVTREAVPTDTAPAMESSAPEPVRPKVTTETTWAEIVAIPQFKDFGKYVLARERVGYKPKMKLADVATTLPFHRYVNADQAADCINQMIERVDDGRMSYHSIGQDVGLFFFRGRPGAPFAIISAGGGFYYVGSIQEGFPLAIALSDMGYNAFVLQYRTGGFQIACKDLARGIDYVFKHAAEWQVDTASYSLWGASAGAEMAAALGSHGTRRYAPSIVRPRPATVILCYTEHADYTRRDPPTYAVVGADDRVTKASAMRRRVANLKAAGIDAEVHVYPNLVHGFGMGVGTSAEGWHKGAVKFWEKYIKKDSVR